MTKRAVVKFLSKDASVMAKPLAEKILKRLADMEIRVSNKDVVVDRDYINKANGYTFRNEDEVILLEIAYPIPFNIKLSFTSYSYGKASTVDTDAGKLWVISEVGKIVWAYLCKEHKGWEPFIYAVEYHDWLEITIVLRKC